MPPAITKHFASLAYMLLCEEGRAGVDDPVGLWLPDLNAVTRAATIRQLMSHVSGLRDVHDICYQLSGTGHAVSSSDLLALYRDIDDVNAMPGTVWSYNNGGYLILSVVIERIAGRSIEDVLSERIFRPAGLRDTMLRRLDTDFVPNSATLHMSGADGVFEKSYLGTALAPVFLATKLDAFHGRGAGDFLASHDLEDVTVLIDGRPELLEEVRTAEHRSWQVSGMLMRLHLGDCAHAAGVLKCLCRPRKCAVRCGRRWHAH